MARSKSQRARLLVVTVLFWAPHADCQGSTQTDIAGLLSGSNSWGSGASPSPSPVASAVPANSPPLVRPPPTINQPPPADWTSPIPPNLAAQPPPGQAAAAAALSPPALASSPPVDPSLRSPPVNPALLSSPAEPALLTPPPASPVLPVAATPPPAVPVALTPPPAAPAALTPPPAVPVLLVSPPAAPLTLPPPPAVPAALNPPPATPAALTPPPAVPAAVPPPVPAVTQQAPLAAPVAEPPAGALAAAGPAASPPADQAGSTLAFVLHLEGAALWPFNATLQARLLTALQSVLPGIPASNFTLVNAVESQPAQVAGRRLLQAATATDVSGQASAASAAAASSAQTTLQSAVNDGSVQAAFNRQGSPSASAVTLTSSSEAAAVPASSCSGGTLVSGICVGNSNDSGSNGLPTWAIIVIAVAGTAVVFSLLTMALCCFLLRRKGRQLTPKLKEASRTYSPKKMFSNARSVQPTGENQAANKQAVDPAKTPAAATANAPATTSASLPAPQAAAARSAAAAAPASPPAQPPVRPAAALPVPQSSARSHTRSPGSNEPSPPRRTSSSSRTRTRHQHESISHTEHAVIPASSPDAQPGRAWQPASSASSLGRQRSGSMVSIGSDGSSASAAFPGVERSPSQAGSATSGPSRISASNQRSSQFASALAPKHANRALAALAKRHAARMTRTLIPGPLSQAYMNKQSTLGGMYRLETGRTFADSRIVAQGVVLGSQRKVIAELFVHATDFYNARRFANAVHSRLSIPDVLDTFDAGEADNKPGSTTPAAMVYAGPDWSLGDLLSDHVTGMSASGRKMCIAQLLEGLDLLHSQGVVHRSLRPDNLVFYEPDQRWRLLGLARWARSGTDAPLVYNLRYTGPEVVKADLMATAVRDRALQGRHSSIDADSPVNGVADPASDMWAAGAIAWHVFTGRPLFEGPLTDSDILGMLLGIRPLPFEEDPTLWVLFSHHQAAHLVQGLLTRRPEERLTAQAALAMARQL